MNKDKEYIDQLIVSYLSGELDDSQICELKSWISLSEENEKYFMQYQEIWASSYTTLEETPKYNSEKAFERFKNRVSEYNNMKSHNSYYIRLRNIYKYAAAVFILGIISYMSFQAGEENLYDSLSMIEIDAPAGGTSRLLLPDSTVVVLNGGSKLSYEQSFGIKNRKVELEGEAYFEVSRNEKKPFSVESQGIRVNVLGTKFNVQNYPEDNIASVSLMEGKVLLDNKYNFNQHVELSPGEKAEFNKETGVLNKKEYNLINNDKLWIQGDLIFDETPLYEVVRQLSRSYGVNISISNENLNDLCIYGRFNRNIQSINDVMSALEATDKINYSILDKEITIY